LLAAMQEATRQHQSGRVWMKSCVARSRQVCIYVVEALLITIYLEGVDSYIPRLDA